VVYYANYLRYLERARTEFLSEKGIDVEQYHHQGFIFVVVHVDINYKRPARLGDIIDVTTDVLEMTNATITLKHQALKGDTLLIESNVKVACLNKDGKPQRLPESFSLLD
jgi:acyl-CoA thioester hydrolase